LIFPSGTLAHRVRAATRTDVGTFASKSHRGSIGCARVFIIRTFIFKSSLTSSACNGRLIVYQSRLICFSSGISFGTSTARPDGRSIDRRRNASRNVWRNNYSLMRSSSNTLNGGSTETRECGIFSKLSSRLDLIINC
jgi:hypothetical protein